MAAPCFSRWNGWPIWPVLTVLLMGVPLLFLRLGALPFHGEESRRVQIAREMWQTGDFLVPRLQGHPWPTKPPLYYWLLAGVIALSGSLDPWVMRVPSALATLTTATLLAWYVQPTLPRWAAFATGFVFLTFGDILDSGHDAEMDATFCLWVTAALLLWYGGRERGWSPYLYWTLGYGLTALACLTKGLQGPIYFGAAAYGWLLLTRRGRELLQPAHFVGLMLFTALLLAWMIPFAAHQGLESWKAVFLHESVSRTVASDGSRFVQHLWLFPLKWTGSLLPWSPLLLGYLLPSVRHRVRTHQPATCFAGLALVLAFPTCWLPPGGEERYLRPVLPCVAVMLGTLLSLVDFSPLPTQQATTQPVFASGLWRGFLAGWGLAALAAAVALLAVSFGSWSERLRDWQEPWPVACGCALLAGGIGFALLCWAGPARTTTPLPAVLALGLLACLCVTGLLTNRNQRRQVDAVGAVAALRQLLGAEARLVSFGPVNHLFLLLYQEPIERRDWPRTPDEGSVAAGDYFCFDAFRGVHPPLPFVWEEVARLTMDRTQRPLADNIVIVGRRISREEAVARRGAATLHGIFP